MDLTPNYGKGSHYWQPPTPQRQQYPSRYVPEVSSAQGYQARSYTGHYGRFQLPQRRSRHYPAQSYIPKNHDIDEAFHLLKNNPQRALDKIETLLTKYEGDSHQYARVVQLKARSLFLLENFDGCIDYINTLPEDLQNNKRLIMAKGRALQARGHFTEALPLFQHLYEKYSTSFIDEKTNGLALGRQLQLMGGTDNLNAARDIFTRLRTRAAEGQGNTPCEDREIELALGILLKLMGGMDNQKIALDILTRLRTRAAGQANTPCEDKEIELALGRHLQAMGGTNQLKMALDILHPAAHPSGRGAGKHPLQ
ncbi:hypothetical protein [Sansalvadorimonas verongulae]|uniref:hypothetical protein n=1 Tax=Sansalvadorimonas verongulae TaxID=2172824 RepID=UPI0012BBE587|nr:hypothetical protein [Sansalvadorimonas verongulae]MTI12575.1 hypothetical protein [Sansalvadorimonas verongulae]